MPNARPAATSGLSEISTWLEQLFRGLWNRRGPVLIMLVVTTAASTAFGFLAWNAVKDIAFADDEWVGVSSGDLMGLAAAGVVIALITLWVLLVVAHQLHHDRLAVQQPLRSSMQAALAGLPRAIGWSLLLFLGFFIAMLVIVALSAVSAGLGAIAGLLMIPLGVFVYVKLAFLLPACVVPMPGRTALAASAQVSSDRFWPVLGRLVLLSLLTAVLSFAFNVPFSVTEQATVEPDDIDQFFVVENEELVFVDVGGLLELLGLDGAGLALAVLPSGITSFLWISGVSGLYAETHRARPEHDPADGAGAEIVG